jgi:sugar phosphate isomerase/epimerase
MNLVEPTIQTKWFAPSALRLGARAHDFGRMPAEELAARIAAGGFSCVQLALNKAVAGLDLQAGDLNADLARQIGGAFARHGVGVEVLGCYVNPIHPDLKTRAALLQFFKDHLRFARDFGCGIVALESGSVNADYSPHPANHGEEVFQIMLASISELVAVAENFGVIVGLEAVTSHTVSTPQKMRRLLDEMASDHLQVVLDPVNLLSPENFRAQSRVVAEALDLLGDDIAVVHAKDFIFENGAMQTVPAGCGRFDFAPILEFVRSRKPEVGVLLEEADETTAGQCRKFLLTKYERVES